MSLIIAARFTTFDAASVAAQRLMDAGVHEDAMHVFYVNPPGAHDQFPVGGDQAADPGTRHAPRRAWGVAALLGAVGAVIGGIIGAAVADSAIPVVVGAGLGAYIGSLAGAVGGMDKKRARVQEPHRAPSATGEGRPSGVMLAVNADGARAQEIAVILVGAGGKEVERAQGRWRGGKWEDFDPTQPPVPEPTAPPSAGQAG